MSSSSLSAGPSRQTPVLLMTTPSKAVASSSKDAPPKPDPSNISLEKPFQSLSLSGRPFCWAKDAPSIEGVEKELGQWESAATASNASKIIRFVAERQDTYRIFKVLVDKDELKSFEQAKRQKRSTPSISLTVLAPPQLRGFAATMSSKVSGRLTFHETEALAQAESRQFKNTEFRVRQNTSGDTEPLEAFTCYRLVREDECEADGSGGLRINVKPALLNDALSFENPHSFADLILLGFPLVYAQKDLFWAIMWLVRNRMEFPHTSCRNVIVKINVPPVAQRGALRVRLHKAMNATAFNSVSFSGFNPTNAPHLPSNWIESAWRLPEAGEELQLLQLIGHKNGSNLPASISVSTYCLVRHMCLNDLALRAVPTWNSKDLGKTSKNLKVWAPLMGGMSDFREFIEKREKIGDTPTDAESTAIVQEYVCSDRTKIRLSTL